LARHPVLVFLALAFGWSLAFELAGLRAVAGFGPSLAGLGAAWLCGGRDSARALLSQLVRWRVARLWWAVALFAPLAIWMIVSTYIAAVVDWVNYDFTRFALFPVFVARHFVLDGLGQELGWRGFLQSTLERRRGATLTGASLAVGAIWTLWQALQVPDLASLARVALLCSAYSQIFGRVLHVTGGSVLVVALLHASALGSEDTVRTAFPEVSSRAALAWVYAGYVVAVALGTLFLRERRPSRSPT